MSTNPGVIYNVSEPHLKDPASLETTAVEAEVAAPNWVESHKVEKNAELATEAAHHAASVAKMKGPELTGSPSTASDKLRKQAQDTATKAVAEGESDVVNEATL